MSWNIQTCLHNREKNKAVWEGEEKRRRRKKAKNQTKPRNKIKPSKSFGLEASTTRSKAPLEKRGGFKTLFPACQTALFCLGASLDKSCGSETPAVDAQELLDSVVFLLEQVKPLQFFMVIVTNGNPGAQPFSSENQAFCVGD